MRRGVIAAVLVVLATLALGAQGVNEEFALNLTRAVAEAQQKYVHSHPQAGYACTLAELEGAGVIETAVASGKANGYKFDLSCPGKAMPRTEYEFVAKPTDFKKTGGRTFCTTQRAGILFSTDGQGKTCLKGGQLVK
ncbi:MAG: hypothetical protein ACE14L_15585 [Terriglobales bacterium]